MMLTRCVNLYSTPSPVAYTNIAPYSSPVNPQAITSHLDEPRGNCRIESIVAANFGNPLAMPRISEPRRHRHPADARRRRSPRRQAVPKSKKEPWPKSLQDRFQSLRNLLERTPTPLAADEAAKHFTRAHKTDVAELLDLLATLGKGR